jgi:multicomponent K+:H+ antiporter subunit E
VTVRATLLPFPRLSATLWALWLLLNETLEPGQVILGGVIALVIPLLVRPVLPPIPVVRAPLKLVGYLLLVQYDILVANLRVARLVLGPVGRLRPAIVVVPLAVGDPVVASILAATVTLTPGTVSIDLDMAARRLTVHVLDAPDEASVVAEIKSRYEARLKEVFGC